ncbi:uncharacterized protein LOC132591472 [Zootoca vivipara]|uniref:uncharacterized protein LOC132591472 n=1 Tax=Zootoca vivipara TaxID=8524 RepID=UPI00293BEEE7|nr:uncharacterized protein LOC132591472 [Zootoca vivipara]
MGQAPHREYVPGDPTDFPTRRRHAAEARSVFPEDYIYRELPRPARERRAAERGYEEPGRYARDSRDAEFLRLPSPPRAASPERYWEPRRLPPRQTEDDYFMRPRALHLQDGEGRPVESRAPTYQDYPPPERRGEFSRGAPQQVTLRDFNLKLFSTYRLVGAPAMSAPHIDWANMEFSAPVRINRILVTAYRDTGSDITSVSKDLVLPQQYQPEMTML